MHADSLGNYLVHNNSNYRISPQQIEDELQRTIKLARSTANLLRADRAKLIEAKLDAANDPHGAKLYKHINTNFTPPTSKLLNPVTNERTSNVNQMLNIIQDAWHPIYNKH